MKVGFGAHAVVSAMMVALFGCGPGRTTDATADAGNGACAAYAAAYDACFDRLGPAARVAGDRALAAAKEQLRASAADDPATQARCEAASKRLAASCR